MKLQDDDAPVAAAGDDMRVTPAMAQYVEIKAANPDCLLFYRMGDFYEMFFDDAETASRALGIMLTKRGKYLGKDVPLCGVPVVRADEYLHRLIALGHRVAVCEQLEDPAEAKKRGSKSVVRRDVVRLVTPGTLTEDTLLDAGRNNLPARGRACARLATTTAGSGLPGSTSRPANSASPNATAPGSPPRSRGWSPARSSSPTRSTRMPTLVQLWRELPAVTPLPRDVFDSATAERRLSDFFAVATSESFGALTRLELTAAAACVTYVERTQLGKRPPLSPPLRESAGAAMAIDQATRANLELMRTLGGDRKGSLLAAIDRTVTSAGSRLLAQRLAAPLTEVPAIERRHDAIAALVKDAALRAELRDRLNKAPDLARALARLAVGRGGPRDLAAIRDGLLAAGEMSRRLAGDWPAEIAEAAAACRAPDAMLAAELSAALAAELPACKRDGGFVRASYDTALDELRALRDESRRVVAALQARYADDTGIKTLKIRHNNVLGYFVEVTAQHGDKLMAPPFNATFIHRQTLAGQVRFTSTELGELEAKIASAGDRALGIELEIFDRLTAQVMAQSAPIKKAAEALAVLDVASALATLAAERDYVRPQVDTSLQFVIEGGRHPVVEQALARDGTPFVANRLRPHRHRQRGQDLAHHRPEHGRQIDVSAPERADRRARADGLVRAGPRRASRRHRPAVLARRRGRRSRARALDLHGRDGRDRRDPQPGRAARARHPRRDRPRHRDIRRAVDRLGCDRAPARRQPVPRTVRDALPRTDRALRPAHAAAQRNGAGEGMAGRRRFPARSRRRCCRPLLRHPGGEAGWLARRSDRARASWCSPSSKRKTAPRRKASRTCHCLPPRRSRSPPPTRHSTRLRARWPRSIRMRCRRARRWTRCMP